MGNGVIAFLVAISASVWIYGKFMRKTGNNTKSSVIAVVMIGIFIFFLVLLLANTLLPD